MMLSLFESCVQLILTDSCLAEGAALHLPSKITHYILYEAVCRKKIPIVEKIVESWPHTNLSFDFFSNPFFRWNTEYPNECIRAHEFCNIHSTVVLSVEVYESIAIGLFGNVHGRLSRGIQPTLQNVDLTNVCTDHQKADILYHLVKGEFLAVRNSSDRNNPKRRLAVTRVKPIDLEVPANLYVNISVQAKISPEMRALLSGGCASRHFKVAVTGLSLVNSTLTSRNVTEVFKVIAVQRDTPLLRLKDFRINPHLIEGSDAMRLLPAIHPNGTLWINSRCDRQSCEHCSDVVTCLLRNTQTMKDLVISSKDNGTINAILTAARICRIGSISLLKKLSRRTDVALTRPVVNRSGILETSLTSFSESLEYLHLDETTPATLPLDVLQTFSNLCVLSMTAGHSYGHTPSYTPSECFNAIRSLGCLQYFEWASSCNVRTADILILYQVLSTTLPHLQHCHLYLLYILLFTTDFDKTEYEPIMNMLHQMLKGLTGDDSCSTYRFNFKHVQFASWLGSVRPSVCTKCGSVLEYYNAISATIYTYIPKAVDEL